MTNPRKEIENLLEKIYATYAPQIRPFEILTDHTEVTIQALKASNRGDSETEEIIDACSDKIHKLAQAYAQLFYSVGGLTLKKMEKHHLLYPLTKTSKC